MNSKYGARPASVAALDCDCPFSMISSDLVLGAVLRPGTGALQIGFENTP
jgi:hypothetical protein